MALSDADVQKQVRLEVSISSVTVIDPCWSIAQFQHWSLVANEQEKMEGLKLNRDKLVLKCSNFMSSDQAHDGLHRTRGQ